MKINHRKTKKLTITRCKKFNTTYKLNGINIDETNEIKFLGIILDSRLTLHSHVSTKLAQASAKIQYLQNMNKLGLSMTAKRRAYIALIRTILEYGSSMLCMLNRDNIKKLETFQNRCLRIITNSDNYTRVNTLYETAKITSLEIRIKSLAKSWLTQAKSNPKNNVYHMREVSLPGYDSYVTPNDLLNNFIPP